MTKSIFAGARIFAAASVGTLAIALSASASAEGPYSFSADIGVVSNYMWRGVSQTQDGPAVQGGLTFNHESGFSAGIWASNVDFNDEGVAQPVTILADPTTPSGFEEDVNGNLVGTTAGSSSSDSANYEVDLSLGYGGNITDDLSYGLSAVYYAYPDGKDSNFAELGASMTFKWFTIGTAYTVFGENDGGRGDDGDWYSYASFEYGDLPFGLGVGLRGGYTSFRYDQQPTGVTYVDAAGNTVVVTDSANYWNYGASITKDAGDFGTFSLNWDQNDGNTDLGFDNDPKIWVGWNKEF
jgi:hypothetical protein